MQVIKMGVGNQYRVDWRQIAHAESGAPKPLQDENPLREVRVDHNVLSANLQKETGVPNEGDAELATAGQYRLARLAAARRKDGTAHQRSDLSGFAPDCDSRHFSLLDAGNWFCDATHRDRPQKRFLDLVETVSLNQSAVLRRSECESRFLGWASWGGRWPRTW